MSIMDSWSERVGDALESARQAFLMHTNTCPSCIKAHVCPEGLVLMHDLERAENDFNDFIDQDED